MRTMTLSIVSSDGSAQPSPVTVTVPKQGKFEDLVHALGPMCSLGNDETLMVAEVSLSFYVLNHFVCCLVFNLSEY